MPKLDGYQVLTQLKRDPALCSIPVIMISAVDDLDRAIRCIEQGAEDYLAKPLNQVLLRARISASLERKRLRDQEQAYLKQLQAEKEAAEMAHRAKSAFLANMSHELRTPLNAIMGYSEMLQEDLQAEGIVDHLADLQKIHASGKHLLHLIDSILDLAKIEAGKMDLHLEQFAISPLIDQIVKESHPVISAKGNRLQVCIPVLSAELYADPSKIRQILLNLLNNANKFMEAGTVVLAVEEHSHSATSPLPSPRPAALSADGVDWIAIKVSDTGIGMTPVQMEQVFHAFTQADDSTTRKYSGAGLGLTIARRFCQLMGGDILVESEVGKGSTFAVWLPIMTRRSSSELLQSAIQLSR
jgi:signal transduction histidine kinase